MQTSQERDTNLIVEIFVHNKPPESGAPLASSSHSSEHRRPDHHVHVGVLGHDQTVVAAQLQQVLPEPLLDRQGNLPDKEIVIFTKVNRIPEMQ